MKVLQHGNAVEKAESPSVGFATEDEKLKSYVGELRFLGRHTIAAMLESFAADRDRLTSENAQLSAALELAREERDDKVDGLESDLSSALDVLWRRGDEEARTWIKLNYPKFPTIAFVQMESVND